MHMRTSFSIIAAAAILTLSGCGGGGGSSGGDTPAQASVNVAASLGRFSQGTPVVVKNASGQQIGSGAIGADGTANISIEASYSGVIVVEVQGGAGVQYFDEGTGQMENFPAGRVMRAVSPTVTSAIAVTPLTNVAAELTGTSLDADTITRNNLAIARQFGLANILSAPAMLGSTSDKVTAANGDAGSYALVLAALAKAAHANGVTLESAIAALATDLRDGDLDGMNGSDAVGNAVLPAAINAAQADSIADFADAASADHFEGIMSDVDALTPTPTAEEIAAAGSTDLAQAKALFANLKAGILPYANDGKTGFLNVQGDKLRAEMDALSDASSDTLNLVTKMATAVEATARGTELPGSCFLDTSGLVALGSTVCYYFDYADGGIVYSSFVMSGSNATWNAARLDSKGEIIPGTTTGGAIAYASGSVTMNGYLPTSQTGRLKVGLGSGSDTDLATEKALVISRQSQGGDVYRYALEGSVTDLANGSTPVAQLVFATGSHMLSHEPVNSDNFDASKVSADVTGTFITSNYRFTGHLAFGNMKSGIKRDSFTYECGYIDPVTSQYVSDTCTITDSWVEFTGGTGSFTGTINGVGVADNDATNDFDILAGKLDFTATPTATYNPNLPKSATNMITGSATINGTVKRSATDGGLNLVLTTTVTGPTTGNVAVTYKDSAKSLNITGSGDLNSEATDQIFDLTSSDGITVRFFQNSTETSIMKGSKQLGTVTKGGRINYIDGTSTSLM